MVIDHTLRSRFAAFAGFALVCFVLILYGSPFLPFFYLDTSFLITLVEVIAADSR